MKRTPLVPCPSCTRHVRVSESSCPFCASAVPEDTRTAAANATVRSVAGLGRAAILGVAIATGVVAAGCGGSEEPAPADTTTPGGDTATTGGDTSTSPGDGTTPPPDDGTVDDNGGTTAEYGAPAP